MNYHSIIDLEVNILTLRIFYNFISRFLELSYLEVPFGKIYNLPNSLIFFWFIFLPEIKSREKSSLPFFNFSLKNILWRCYS
jgi:hypothetical protein